MAKDLAGRKRGWRMALATGAAVAAFSVGAAAAEEWGAYGHDAGGMRFSPLAQINRANVSGLKVAWVFHTGDIADGSHGRRSGFETTPLFVDGKLFITTPFNRVIALDPATGRRLWAFDPKIDQTWSYGDGLINRGAAAWLDGEAGEGAICRRRIFEATLDARLISLDAETGKPCEEFGEHGQASLRDVEGYVPGEYHMTSPPVVVDDVVVVGSAIDDNDRTDMPSGVVRGYDARTGRKLWSWAPLQSPARARPGAPRRTGAGNAWSVMTADPDRHLVFVPTGSASPDYYGGLRPGDNRWANSVVALDPRTGKLAWGFQLVHHDLWDYDTAASPLLADLPGKDGAPARPVVVAGNKSGFLYVLDRVTGKPVYPVEERPVPQSDVPGETASPTQPFPTILPALAPQSITPDQAWGITEEDRQACRALIEQAGSKGVFTPPSTRPGIAIPGNVGGMNWSGYAYDPGRRLLLVETNNLPARIRLIPREQFRDQARHGVPHGEYTGQTGAPYGIERLSLLSPHGLPCAPPPWGMLSAVDLTNGRIAWQVPLGSVKELSRGAPGIPPGSVALGGPIVTAGGLVFEAGTLDRSIHGFDIDTGKEIWTGELPASAHAMPMTYEVGGKQYLVIAAGGSAKITEEAQSDAVVAFALP